jgi:REP element-mobilizing transposase RayT
MKQLSLFEKPLQTNYKTVHGGTRTKGSRKTARPLSVKHSMHLVLKAKRAQGTYSLYKHDRALKNIIAKYAKRYGIVIQDLVNMGNHLHIRLKITRREYFGKFLKTITALIARVVTKAKKGNRFGKFWDALAFTRVLKTRYELLQLRGYFKANRIEHAHGYKARENYLQEFNEWIYRLKKLKTAAVAEIR